MRGDLSVRQLAEFLFRRGDLYAASAGRRIEPDVGIKVQRALQVQRAQSHPEYERELQLGATLQIDEETRRLSGRADGFYRSAQSTVIIEEFKTCGQLPEQPDSVDFGQALLYCGLYSLDCDDAVAQIEAHLVYVQADSLQERAFTAAFTPGNLRLALAFLTLCFAARWRRHRTRTLARRAWVEGLAFPHAEFRPSQQAMARRVYKSLSAGERLLLEAPTGSGKSIATLFPATKAMQEDAQTFFLTSRNSGARAALAALNQLDPVHEALASVEIIAKEKACLVPGMPCDPLRCQYAAGYYDRIDAAVDEVLAVKFADHAAVAQIAQAHTVCPFELSLDAALWSDFVIGDYNYVFDPVVRLKRFEGHKQLLLLIDEAHQLSPRTRDMLSVSIERADVRQAKSTGYTAIDKRVASIDRALTKLKRTLGEGEHTVENYGSVERAMQRLIETVAELEIPFEEMPQLTPLYFSCIRWQRSANWYDAMRFTHQLSVSGRDVKLTRLCLDPAVYIDRILSEHGASVRFSGTLSPLPLYQRLHGQTDQPAERAQSPFDPDQARVFVVPDIPTYYRKRTQHVPGLAAFIQDVFNAHPGRYLVSFPSYSYLQQVHAALLSRISADSCAVHLLTQERRQGRAELDALLETLTAQPCAILFIVAGGTLGESVDFTDIRFHGVMLVGLGLPPPSLQLDAISAYFDAAEGAGWGQVVAYTQPALVKNIQAAGRLIRSPQDRGVVCLVDERYARHDISQFLPGSWSPQVASSREVPDRIQTFWQSVERDKPTDLN